MKRPIFIATISSINGIIIGVYLKKSIPFIVLCSAFYAVTYLYKIIKNQMKEKSKNNVTNINKAIILYLIILNIFCIYTCNKDDQYNTKYEKFDENEMQIIGTVISDIEEKEYKYTYKIKVESINGNKIYKGDYLLINSPKSKVITYLHYGDKIQFTGTYNKGSGQRNYKGFDYQFYLKTQKIYGTIIDNGKNTKILKKENINIFNFWNHSLVSIIKNNIKRLLPERTANLELGIILGYKKEIEEDIIESFKNSNVTHMIAVSGQHMGYVILMIEHILSKKKFGNRGQKIISILIIIIFIRLTGATLSVVRAGVTAILYLVASLVYRKADIKTTISIVALASFINNPFSIFNIGMQLSYAGTISIILFYNTFLKKVSGKLNKGKYDEVTRNVKEGIKSKQALKENILKKKIKDFILETAILTLSANILIIPIMIYHFNTISLTFLFSNLLIGPLVAISMFLGFFIIVISLFSFSSAKIPALALDFILNIVIKITKFFGNLKSSTIYVVTPSILHLIFIYIVIFLSLYMMKKQQKMMQLIKKNKIIIKKIMPVVLAILIVSKICILNIPKNLRVHFIDVGQGDCSLIITPYNKKILIDGGGNEGTNTYDVGRQILIPYLLDRKIKKIDYVIISHFDSDHVRADY